MKKLLLATMLVVACAVQAAPVTLDFSYVDGEINYYGIGNTAQTFDVAIFLPGEDFEGCKIKAINVPLYTPNGIADFSEPKVWLSSALKLKDSVNDANIASYDAEMTSGSPVGNIGLTLPEEYTITDAGVYVGYSFTVERYNAGTRYPLVLSMGTNRNSCFVHSTVNLTEWQNVNASDGLSSALTVTMEAVNMSVNNVSFVSVPDFVLASFEKQTDFPVTLKTSASEPVSSVDFEFTFAGNAQSYHYDLPTPVPASFSTSFEAMVQLPAYNERLREDVVVKVAKVNGVENESENNSATINVGVVPVVPKRQALFEECTCTKCPYCVRGYAALEYLKANYPEFICVSYHNNWQGSDPMNMGNPPFYAAGNPAAAINRTVEGIDPYYGSQTYINYELPVIGDILAQNAIVTPWDIQLSHTWVDDDNLTANVTVSNVLGFENQTYKIGYILVSDGLTGTTSGWYQSNGYSYESPAFVPELNDFCSGGKYGRSSVRDLVFNDVVISTSGNKGVVNSIPKSLEADEAVNHSQTWNLGKIKSELIPDKNKLRIVAFVLDNRGKVLNAVKQDITDFTPMGVEILDEGNADAPVEYYNLNGVKVENPSNGIFIRRQGSKTTKVVVK